MRTLLNHSLHGRGTVKTKCISMNEKINTRSSKTLRLVPQKCMALDLPLVQFVWGGLLMISQQFNIWQFIFLGPPLFLQIYLSIISTLYHLVSFNVFSIEIPQRERGLLCLHSKASNKMAISEIHGLHNFTVIMRFGCWHKETVLSNVTLWSAWKTVWGIISFSKDCIMYSQLFPQVLALSCSYRVTL